LYLQNETLCVMLLPVTEIKTKGSKS